MDIDVQMTQNTTFVTAVLLCIALEGPLKCQSPSLFLDSPVCLCLPCVFSGPLVVTPVLTTAQRASEASVAVKLQRDFSYTHHIRQYLSKKERRF